MSKTNFPSKELLSELYLKGGSMFEIANRLNCSVHKVAYWMNKYDIKRRTPSEATYRKLNPNGDPFEIKIKLSPAEQLLFGLGIGIYWGEGEKVSRGQIRVANTDPFLLLKFRQFLLDICQVTLSRIWYSIICFNDSNPLEVRSYWSKILEISPDRFGKIVQISSQGKGTYRKKSQYGVCILGVSNTKLKLWMMEELKKFKS